MIDSLTFFNFAKFSSPLVLYLVLMVIVRIALDKIPLFKLTLSSICRRDGKKYFTYAHHMYLFNCYIGNVWNRYSRSFSRIGAISMVLCIALIGLSSFQLSDEIFRLTIAKASKLNSRNSESDIIRLKNGNLLLGWTQFYAGSGADDPRFSPGPSGG